MRQSTTSIGSSIHRRWTVRQGWTASLLAGPTVAICALLASCHSGPDAPPPSDPPTDDALISSTGSSASASASSSVTTAAPVARWWEQLDDTTLNMLMVRAEANNQTLAASLANVRVAYAAVGATESQLWPSVGFGAQYTRTLTNIAQLASTGVNVEPYNTYAYGVGLSSWEIDLWGGIGRQVEAAQATAQQQLDSMRDVLVSVRGQVGSSYIQLRTLQGQRGVLVDNAAALVRALQTVQARYSAGTTTGLDLARSQSQLDGIEAQIPQIDAGIYGSMSTLAVLCGVNPSEMQGLLAAAAPIPTSPEIVGVGLPADLLERRPDVRKAKQQLIAATALIGAAEAQRLPSLSISGNFYIASNDVSGLSSIANKAYSIGPSLYLPIFNGGRIDSTILQQKAQAEAAFATYRGAVISAVGDLSASVSDFVQARETLARSSAAQTSATNALTLAEQQFNAGTTDITTLLDMQRAKLDADNSVVEARGGLTQGYVSLGRALGGGWSEGDQKDGVARTASAAQQETKP